MRWYPQGSDPTDDEETKSGVLPYSRILRSIVKSPQLRRTYPSATGSHPVLIDGSSSSTSARSSYRRGHLHQSWRITHIPYIAGLLDPSCDCRLAVLALWSCRNRVITRMNSWSDRSGSMLLVLSHEQQRKSRSSKAFRTWSIYHCGKPKLLDFVQVHVGDYEPPGLSLKTSFQTWIFITKLIITRSCKLYPLVWV